MKLFKKIYSRVKIFLSRFSTSKKEKNTSFESRLDSAEEQIAFMSAVIAEQSRLLASLAYVQNDLAESISAMSGSTGGDLYIRIPQASDDFIN